MHREYHYNTDNLDSVNKHSVKESFWGLYRLIGSYEEDYIPVLNYKSPLYLSRYGLYIDPTRDPGGYRNIEHMQNYVNGSRSCMDIAIKLEIDFHFVKGFFDQAHEKGLISKLDRLPKKSDRGSN